MSQEPAWSRRETGAAGFFTSDGTNSSRMALSIHLIPLSHVGHRIGERSQVAGSHRF
jgi:hypothetical protein